MRIKDANQFSMLHSLHRDRSGHLLWATYHLAQSTRDSTQRFQKLFWYRWWQPHRNQTSHPQTSGTICLPLVGNRWSSPAANQRLNFAQLLLVTDSSCSCVIVQSKWIHSIGLKIIKPNTSTIGQPCWTNNCKILSSIKILKLGHKRILLFCVWQ